MGGLTEKANPLVHLQNDSTQMVAVRQVGIKCYNTPSSLMESLCCRIVPTKVGSGMGHCARCVESDMHWDFWGSKVIRHLSPLLEGLKELLERFCGHVDIGNGLNHGEKSSVICINGKSRVGGDTAFGIVDVQ